MADFYKKHEDLCVQDVTSKDHFLIKFLDGNKVQVKITEYGPELMKNIRRQSGFNEDFLMKYNFLPSWIYVYRSFAPKENQEQMAKF